MPTCEEARKELERAQERASHEREVMRGYEESKSNLEYEHSDATRRWEDTSSLVVTNEREWEAAREVLRGAIEAEREAGEKLKYWDEQKRRVENGEPTDYNESNKVPYIRDQRDKANDANYNARDARSRAEDSVRDAKDRYEESKRFLQERANAKFAIEDKQSTLRNRIDLQRAAVSEAAEWVGNAERQVNEVC